MESVLLQLRDTDVVADDGLRLERAARENFRFLWRCLHRFGVKPGDAVDDAVQRVFEIATQKCHQIEPGRERAFLFKTALLVAAEERRRARRRREVGDEAAVRSVAASTPAPDEIVEQRQWRKLLEVVLDKMDFDCRTVFVLFEFEGISTLEIARLLEIPAGTAASRLRRAREAFHREACAMRARLQLFGGVR